MAEIIGAVGSVLTFCQVALAGVHQIRRLYKEPAEIDKLLVQLHLLEKIVREVETISPFPEQGVLSESRSRARLIIVELKSFVDTELLGQRAISNRARRKIWLKNRSKILKLRDRVNDVRETLSEALNAHSALSTSRLEKGLAVIERRLDSIVPTNLKIRQVHAANYKGCGSMDRIRNSTSANTVPSSQYTGIVKYVHDFAAYYSRTSVNEPKHEERIPAGRKLRSKRSFVEGTGPVSCFETLPSFRPEEYTSQDISSRLHGFYIEQISSSDFVATTHSTVLYRVSPRNWKRFLLRLTITMDSSCWIFQGVKDPPKKTTEELPTIVSSTLKEFLASQHEFHQDTCIEIFLGHQPLHAQPFKPLVRRIQNPFPAAGYLKTATLMLRHLNCPWYSDREIMRWPLRLERPTNEFLAYCDSQWVREIRFSTQKTMIDADLYTLQVFHSVARDAPGIASFVGLVLDDETQIVNGFLCKLPVRGRLTEMLTDENHRGLVTWDRCVRWCYQIVQGVAEIHSKGLVVGTLTTAPCLGVAIDSNDNAELYRRFSTSFHYDDYSREVVPPECYSTELHGVELSASPVTDVYQLGLLLWRIAALKSRTTMSICTVAGCKSSISGPCMEAHATSAQLPCLEDLVPHYLQHIIAMCRMEDPERRLPAHELLELFPDSVREKAKLATPVSSPASPLQPRALHDMYKGITSCSHCLALTTPRSFHCNICHGADFDLCPPCFLEKGLHCEDESHVLQEHIPGEECARYYSNIKASGFREIIVQHASH